VLNGIEELSTRGDLLDRALLVCLPTIPDDQRRTEEGFWSDFDRARPRILGALLTAVSAGLRNWPTVQLPGLPRMADFAHWAAACEPALGLDEGAFLRSYRRSIRDANEVALESSPVVGHLFELVRGGVWEGTAANFLTTLNDMAADADKRLRAWPKTPRAVAGLLRRLAPNLRRAGFEVTFGRQPGGNRTRTIKVQEYTPDRPDRPDGPKPSKNQGKTRDGRRDGRDGRRERGRTQDKGGTVAGRSRDGTDSQPSRRKPQKNQGKRTNRDGGTVGTQKSPPLTFNAESWEETNL
jgi:hypothetical protein